MLIKTMKLIPKFLTIAILLVSSSLKGQASLSIPEYVPKSGLISWWGFNNTFNDYNSNKNDFHIQNGKFVTDRNGMPNSAILFNGKTEFLQLKNPVDIPCLNSNYSISFWFNSNEFPSRQSMVGWGVSNAPGTVNVTRLAEEGGILHYHWARDIYCETEIEVKKWTHILITYDGTINNVYLNGTLINSQSPYQLNVNSNVLYIGASMASGIINEYFNGSIDDVGIWNRQLSSEEIKNLFESKLSQSKPNAIVNKNQKKEVNELFPIKDIHTECMVYLSESNLSVEWDGECREGYINGKGKLNIYFEGKLVCVSYCTMESGYANGYFIDSFPISKSKLTRSGQKLNGEFNGTLKQIYLDGKIETIEYKNGLKDGPQIIDYSQVNGYSDIVIKTEVYWKNNRLNQKDNYTQYFNDGVKVISSIDSTGKEYGLTTFITKGYKIIGKWDYEQKDFIGNVDIFYDDGVIIKSGWGNGKLNGEYTRMDANGNVFKGIFVNGQTHGNGRLSINGGFEFTGVWNNNTIVSGKLVNKDGIEIPYKFTNGKLQFDTNKLSSKNKVINSKVEEDALSSAIYMLVYNSFYGGTTTKRSNTVNQNNNSVGRNSNQNKQKCYYCQGTGNCGKCSKTFSKPYYQGNGSYKWRNETKQGYTMCQDCFGRGHKQRKSSNGGWEPDKKCYVSNCQDGWVNCTECNNYSNGKNLGKCKTCKGSGNKN
jgi:hypothetical protein